MSAIYDVPSVYATIGAAVAALPSNMSGQGVHEIVVEAGTYSELVEILGRAGESASNYIVLRAAAGDESSGIFGGGVIVNGSGPQNSGVVKSYSGFSEIRDIQPAWAVSTQQLQPLPLKNLIQIDR